jgi:3-hydroxyisobutyrate dehydrogenase
MGVTGDGASLRVAVLGTGIMGSAMARRLVAAGLPTTVWDRSTEATAALTEAGARAADSPADAVAAASAVITMLPNADVVSSVIFDHVADAFSERAVWAQMGTIGVPETLEVARRLAQLRPDVMFLDAPVSGTKGPAEHGQLLILASGPAAAQPVIRPAFDAIGRKTVWLGDVGAGSRMKLAVNAYMAVLIEGVAEALELAARLGIDSGKLAEAIEGGPLDAPIADAKLHKMVRGDYAPQFPLQWALKDVDLAIEAAGDDGVPLLAALSRQWRSAVQAGHGRQDVSAVRLALDARRLAGRESSGRESSGRAGHREGQLGAVENREAGLADADVLDGERVVRAHRRRDLLGQLVRIGTSGEFVDGRVGGVYALRGRNVQERERQLERRHPAIAWHWRVDRQASHPAR